MKNLSSKLLFPLLVIVIGASSSFAQTTEHEPESDHEATHDFHPNLLALFVGVTNEGSERGVALGIEYERRLSKLFGVGALVEHTFGDLDSSVYAIPLAYHTGRWKLYMAPGVEDGDLGKEFLIRLGGEYAYEVGAWEISPQVDVDFVDGDQSVVLGITFGKGF